MSFKVASVKCLEGASLPMKRSISNSVNNLELKIQKGDIVNTSPRKPVGIWKAFGVASRGIQGTEFGHTAIYDGDGGVIEARGGSEGGFFIRRRLDDLARCNRLVVSRVKSAKPEDTNGAVEWMSSMVGKRAVTPVSMVRHGLRPTILSGKHEGKRLTRLGAAICSSQIANAYARVPFNANRRIADTRPSDILRSKHVKRVGMVQ